MVGFFPYFKKKKKKGTKSDVVWPSDSKYSNGKWSNFGTGAAHTMPFNWGRPSFLKMSLDDGSRRSCENINAAESRSWCLETFQDEREYTFEMAAGRGEIVCLFFFVFFF